MIAVPYFTILGDIARARTRSALWAAMRSHAARFASDRDWPDVCQVATARWGELPSEAGLEGPVLPVEGLTAAQAALDL